MEITMNSFFLVFLVCLGLALYYRINMIAFQILHIRKALLIMADNIATLDLVKKLARAVVNAQESEANAEEAESEAVAALSDLKNQVTLDPEATDLISRALGNAVAAPPVDADPITTPDDGTTTPPVDTTPVDTAPVDNTTEGIDVGSNTVDVDNPDGTE